MGNKVRCRPSADDARARARRHKRRVLRSRIEPRSRIASRSIMSLAAISPCPRKNKADTDSKSHIYGWKLHECGHDQQKRHVFLHVARIELANLSCWQ